MKTLSLSRRGSLEHERACRFAQQIYMTKLSVEIKHAPEYLFVLKEKQKIVGCMGLNSTVEFELISRDSRFKTQTLPSSQEINFGEQSVFVLDGFCAGLPILISIVAEYARYIKIDKIAYVAINVSQKTIERLGFQTLNLGLVELSVLSITDQQNCVRWFDLYSPQLCILDTKKAPEIGKRVFSRFSHKVRLDEVLANEIAIHRANFCKPL